MRWEEVDCRQYLAIYREYGSLKITKNDTDSMEYSNKGSVVLKATNMTSYPRYWIPSGATKPTSVVHKSRNEVVQQATPKVRQPTMTKPELSKKDKAIIILQEMKKESTLNRSTAIKKFQSELGVSPAYAATLWQNNKDSV